MLLQLVLVVMLNLQVLHELRMTTRVVRESLNNLGKQMKGENESVKRRSGYPSRNRFLLRGRKRKKETYMNK